MKYYHISDLHLGREFNGYDITDDQRYVLNDILNKLKDNNAKYLLLSGDIYDKYNPSNEAQALFDWFLGEVTKLNIRTIIISGNHDSKDRLEYLKGFLVNYNVYIYTKADSLTFDDDKVSFCLLPYYHDLELKHEYKDVEGDIYEHIISDFMSKCNKDYTKICLCHNTITGGVKSASERIITVGGIDSMSASLFDDFDYTALGHLHMIQNISDKVKYSGSILKYSVDEFKNNNSMLCYDSITKQTTSLLLNTLYGYRTIEGKFDDIVANASTDPNREKDYVDIRLTDQLPISNAFNILAGYYTKIVGLRNGKAQDDKELTEVKLENINIDDPFTIFKDFYKQIMSEDISQEESDIISEIVDEIIREVPSNEV